MLYYCVSVGNCNNSRLQLRLSFKANLYNSPSINESAVIKSAITSEVLPSTNYCFRNQLLLEKEPRTSR